MVAMQTDRGLLTAPTTLRVLVAVVLVGHGVIHLMGMFLSWGLGQPGELRYADLPMGPRSGPALVLGGLWLLACVAFLASGVAVVLRRPIWWWLASTGVVCSLPVVILHWQIAVAGLAVDLLVIVGLALTWNRGRLG